MDNSQRNEEIIRRRLAGEAPRAIGRSLNVSAGTVSGVLHRTGLTAFDPRRGGRGGGYPQGFRERAVALCRELGSYKAAAALDGKVSDRVIRNWAAAA